MWPFKRKAQKRESPESNPTCPHCRSTHTVAVASYDSDQANSIRIWRGQRYVAGRCLDCGREFYTEEPPEGLAGDFLNSNELVDNEEELQAAEEELKRQAEDDDDRRCR